MKGSCHATCRRNKSALATHQWPGVACDREQALNDLWGKVAQPCITAVSDSAQRENSRLAQAPVLLFQSSL